MTIFVRRYYPGILYQDLQNAAGGIVYERRSLKNKGRRVRAFLFFL
jgi:hypothetical protein